jgi:phospholipase C
MERMHSLAWFEQFQTAPNGSALAQKGMSFIGLDAFYDAAAQGVLPQVSYIIGPAELSEHPPFGPQDGGWLQQQVVNAVIKSPKYSSTVLMISYDETGGWGDQ